MPTHWMHESFSQSWVFCLLKYVGFSLGCRWQVFFFAQCLPLIQVWLRGFNISTMDGLHSFLHCILPFSFRLLSGIFELGYALFHISHWRCSRLLPTQQVSSAYIRELVFRFFLVCHSNGLGYEVVTPYGFLSSSSPCSRFMAFARYRVNRIGNRQSLWGI